MSLQSFIIIATHGLTIVGFCFHTKKNVKASCWDTFGIVELIGMLTRVESKVREY